MAVDSATQDFFKKPMWAVMFVSIGVLVLLEGVAYRELSMLICCFVIAAAMFWRAIWLMRTPYVRMTPTELVVGMAPARRPRVFTRFNEGNHRECSRNQTESNTDNDRFFFC